jgi:hypothetical protein
MHSSNERGALGSRPPKESHWVEARQTGHRDGQRKSDCETLFAAAAAVIGGVRPQIGEGIPLEFLRII